MVVDNKNRVLYKNERAFIFIKNMILCCKLDGIKEENLDKITMITRHKKHGVSKNQSSKLKILLLHIKKY